MKYIAPIFLLLFSCTQTTSKPQAATKEQRLLELRREYVSKFKAASNPISKNEIKEEYQKKIQSFITDSCGSRLDSVLIRVESITAPSNDYASIDLSLRPINVEYNTIIDSSNYGFIKGLSEGKEFTGSIQFTSPIELNDADRNNIIRVKGTPVIRK
jgi:lantibiotic modifying enzyme